MSKPGRILLIFGAVAAAAGAGGYYFFKVYQPRETQRAAQEEIERWEQRLVKVRACLLGATPGSSKPIEALALRELSPDPWDRSTCTKLVSRLSRGDAMDTGLLEVEEAWRQMDKAATHVAVSFLAHVDPGGEAPAKRAVDPLPGALDALDEAHAALRKSAGMDAPTLPGDTHVLPVAELVPLRDGAEPVLAVDAWLPPSTNGIFALGKTKTTSVQLTLPPGGAAKVSRILLFERRSITDPTWGAITRDQQVDIGAIDADGALQATTHVKPKLPKPDDRVETLLVLFALGNASAGVLAYDDGDLVGIVRSVGTPALTEEKPIETSSHTFAVDVAGRALLAWSTIDGALLGTIITPGTPTTVVPLGSGSANASCITAKHAWIASYDQFVSFDGVSATPHALPGHELVSCDAGAALFRDLAAKRYAVCTTECRMVAIRGERPNSMAALADGHVITVATRGPVLGVWREKGAPIFVSVPAGITPRLVQATAKVVDILADTEAGSVVVRVPL